MHGLVDLEELLYMLLKLHIKNLLMQIAIMQLIVINAYA